MKYIVLLLHFTLAEFAHAADATIIGGFVEDTDQWQSGYYVTISRIDEAFVKDAYIKSQYQEVSISEGEHAIKITCAFEPEPKTALVGEKELKLNFLSDRKYELIADINFKKKVDNRLYRYCEPFIQESGANKAPQPTPKNGADEL